MRKFIILLSLAFCALFFATPSFATPIAVPTYSPSTPDVGTKVTLDATKSYDTSRSRKIVSVQWQLLSLPTGSGLTLGYVSGWQVSFTPDVAGSYVIQCRVKNNAGVWSSWTKITITTSSSDSSSGGPVAVCPDQTVALGSAVTLDATKSYDNSGTINAVQWRLNSKPAGSGVTISGSNATGWQMTFKPDVAGSYSVGCRCGDTTGLWSSWISINVTVTSSTPPPLTSNNPPVANAGSNQTVTAGATVTLDGSGSSDAENESLTYQWTISSKPSGSSASLSNPTAIKPTFVADVAGTYVASLVVSDANASSNPSTVTITANASSSSGSGSSGGSSSGSSSTTSNVYGNIFRFFNLAEWDMNMGSDRKVSLRFRAQHTGSLVGIRGYWGVHNGYGAGTGGRIHLEVQKDDGTANHNPSGTSLGGTDKAVNYSNGSCSLGTVLGGVQVISTINFDQAVPVVSGQLYHIVMWNSDSNPTTNWWSPNTSFYPNPTTPCEPATSDVDLQFLAKYSASSSWSNRWEGVAGMMIFNLPYADGYNQGFPYMEMRGNRPVYGANKTRQQFTVSGNSKIVTGINVSTYKSGSPPALTVKIQNGNGNDLFIGTIAASAFGTSSSTMNYGTVAVPSVVLNAGQKYYLEFSAPSGNSSNCYNFLENENGAISYGFTGGGFVDGAQSGNNNCAQYTSGSSWSTDDNRCDLMAYFNIQ